MENWKSSDTFFLVVGLLQATAAACAFLFIMWWAFAVSAYLRPKPGPVLLLMLWGLVTGITLAVLRTVYAARLAAIWYLPIGFLLLVAAFRIRVGGAWASGNTFSFFAGLMFVAVFVILVVPIFPGHSAQKILAREKIQ
jgi:hypothetical protein